MASYIGSLTRGSFKFTISTYCSKEYCMCPLRALWYEQFVDLVHSQDIVLEDCG